MSIELNYLVSTSLIKISILCFYRRITGSLKNAFVYWVWGAIVSCVIEGLSFTLLVLFTCTSVVGYFHLYDTAWRSQNELQCRNEGAIVVACAVISTLQDLIICLLPVFLLWNLRMPKRQKAALCGNFGLGLVTCVCGILRTYYATYVYFCKLVRTSKQLSCTNIRRYLRYHLVRVPRVGVDCAGSRSRYDLRIRARAESLFRTLPLCLQLDWWLQSIREQWSANPNVLANAW